MEHLIWRIDGVPPTLPPAFEAGLRLHIEHASLTSIVVQLAQQQHTYLSATACDGCRRGRCVPGCPVALLQRLVHATLGRQVRFVSVRGLARRLYSRVQYVRPTADSVPITAADLAPWADARLMQHWQYQRGALMTALIIAVGDGPPLDTVLHARNWAPLRMPISMVRRLGTAPIPSELRFLRQWDGPPYLLTDQPVTLPVQKG